MGWLFPDVRGEIAMRPARSVVAGHTEVMRLWLKPGAALPVVLVNIASVSAPAAFGTLVADGLGQIAKAFAAGGGMTEAEAMRDLLAGFERRRKSMREAD